MRKSLTLKSEPNLHGRNSSIFLNHIVSSKIVLRMKNLKLTSYQVPEIERMLCALIKFNWHLYIEILHVISESQDMESSTVSNTGL